MYVVYVIVFVRRRGLSYCLGTRPLHAHTPELCGQPCAHAELTAVLAAWGDSSGESLDSGEVFAAAGDRVEVLQLYAVRLHVRRTLTPSFVHTCTSYV